MLDKLGGRKALVSVVIVLVSALVDAFSKAGLSANMVDVLEVVAMAFIGGNTVEHVSRRLVSRGSTSAPKEVAPEPQGEVPAVAPAPPPPIEQPEFNVEAALNLIYSQQQVIVESLNALHSGVGLLVSNKSKEISNANNSGFNR